MALVMVCGDTFGGNVRNRIRARHVTITKCVEFSAVIYSHRLFPWS